jgi:2-octaprenylphenol hydroxylase
MSTAETAVDFDVAIVGGGIVGLAFARLLAAGLEQAGNPWRIVLLEVQPPEPVAEDADIDLRVSAIAPASRAILQNMDVWDKLPARRVSAYEHMCVWQAEGTAGGAKSISFAAAEIGEAWLGHIVENRAMRLATWKQVEDATSVTVISGQKPVSLSEASDHCCITLEDSSSLRARLVVGADSSRSWVREQLGVSFREHLHGQSAIVAHIASERPHAATAWQRFLPGGPVALLPLADGRSSLVWSCPDAQAKKLLEMDGADFNVELAVALDHVLGSLECTTQRVSFPLGSGHAAQYTGRRFALIGDAAHRVHPLAGQGVNLGLLDAAVLAEELVAHFARPAADPGDPLVLRRYERARKGDNMLTLGAMDAINYLFAGPAGAIGGLGLGVVDKLPLVKAQFAAYAMGRGRSLPAAARLIDS